MQPITLIVIFAGLTILLLAYGILQFSRRRRTVIEDRVRTYVPIEEEAAIAAKSDTNQTSAVGRLVSSLVGRGYFQRLEEELARSDVPMRPSEYILSRFVLAGVGLVIGYYLLGHFEGGLFLAVLGFFLPVVFMRVHQNKRRTKFVKQLADALMLLTNSLRSGYSFLKGLELVAKEMSDPISKELYRTLREVNLGATVDEAMQNLGRRVNSADLDIVISAYLVQKEVGGNLTEIMQKVAETIRERIRIQGDIKVLTAQGRMSGLFVGSLPIIVGILIWLSSPDYFNVIVGPPLYPLGAWKIPLGILLFIGAFIWQLIGGYIIWKIISIKV